ncbi:MAG: hypothetical protein K6C32_04905 [Bacilli bacterium]|nr:hypothetical protein [Bacilli bacterium]
MFINKENVENILNDLAKQIRKKNKAKGLSCELIIVGGASILLNYGFRDSTEDIDCYDSNGLLMNEVIDEIAKKYSLPSDWINTSFIHSSSYSPKLVQYSTFYKTYCNGVLIVRTIKDEYLLAMKMVSARKYKNDYSDVAGIIHYLKSNNIELTFERIEKAVIDLYGDTTLISKEMIAFVKREFASDNNDYEDVKEIEKNNRLIAIKTTGDKDAKIMQSVLDDLQIIK